VQVIEWRGGTVRFLDQTRLPAEEVYRETTDPADLAAAIKRLEVRGAPLIGIAAAYGVSLALRQYSPSAGSIESFLAKTFTMFKSTRPTAVNLFWALDRMERAADRHKSSSLEDLGTALLNEALAIHREDAAMCDRIGEAGAELLPNAASVLTHCNTGMLATGGRGTALGILRTAWERHKLKHVYVDETRPLLQGSRLTAWELSKLGIPFTLITDSMAGFLMQQGKVNAVVVGADRIAANGDVANKVGTYGLAVLARFHEIPFYVAAPVSTLDLETKSGKDIEIEQRSPAEVVAIAGQPIAPADVDVYSPAFDITPHDLIAGIVTERGVLRPPYAVSLCGLKQAAESGAVR